MFNILMVEPAAFLKWVQQLPFTSQGGEVRGRDRVESTKVCSDDIVNGSMKVSVTATQKSSQAQATLLLWVLVKQGMKDVIHCRKPGKENKMLIKMFLIIIMHAFLMIMKTVSFACSSFRTLIFTELSYMGLNICDDLQLLRCTQLVLKY